MCVYSRNLEIMFFFFFYRHRVVRLPPYGTLDAKSFGHGLTRSRCVHVHPTVSNCQTTAPPPPQHQPRGMCLSYVGTEHAVFRLVKSIYYDQQRTMRFKTVCVVGGESYDIIFFITLYTYTYARIRKVYKRKSNALTQLYTYAYICVSHPILFDTSVGSSSNSVPAAMYSAFK